MKNKSTLFIAALSVVAFLVFGFSRVDNGPDKRDLSIQNNSNTKYEYIQHGPALSSPLSALNESFEGPAFPPAGWIKINVAPGATGWNRQLSGTTPVPGFNGGYITVPTGGGTAVAFCSYATGGTTTNDQWLITPQLTNIQAADSLKFWMRKFGTYLDHMDIKISTTTPTVAAMTVTVANLTFQVNDSGWVSYSYPIGTLVTPGANIYIGFRQWVLDANADGACFSLDLVSVTGPVGVAKNTEVPASFSLLQNYPNPFNPSTTIEYNVPKNEFVKIAVYNSLGQEVALLVNEFNNAGSYKINFDASNLPSGIYIYKMSAGDFSQVQKMVLVK